MFVFICACAVHVVLCVDVCMYVVGVCMRWSSFSFPLFCPPLMGSLGPERLSGNKQVMALIFLEGPFSGGVLPLPQLPAYFT